MANQVVLDAKGKRADLLAREIGLHAADGRDVVVVIAESASPERIVKIIHFALDGMEVELTVRHAELHEYISNAAAGAAIGAGVGVAGVLVALAAGNPVTLGPVLAAIGLGALIGAAMGAGSTPITHLAVYKYRGETRLKFSAAS